MRRQSETTAQLNRNSTTYAEAKAGRKNILINPNGVINQRGWDGNWSATPANVYGPDRWRRRAGTNKKEQPIVEGEYKPNTVYTLSGTGIATEQLTSPASGTWNVSVPFDATDLQLEEGEIATAQEWRSESEELSLCRSYYGPTQRFYVRNSDSLTNGNRGGSVGYVGTPRVDPAVTLTTTAKSNSGDPGSIVADRDGVRFLYSLINAGPVTRYLELHGVFDAEVHL